MSNDRLTDIQIGFLVIYFCLWGILLGHAITLVSLHCEDIQNTTKEATND